MSSVVLNYSWLDKYVNGVKINAAGRNQLIISKVSCVAHALCPIIETQTKIKWVKSGNSKASTNYRVDVNDVLKKYDPPTTPKKLLDAIVRDGGRIKIEGEGEGGFYFDVKGATLIDINDVSKGNSEPEPEVLSKLKLISEYGIKNGPFFGSFYVSKYYGDEEIYHTPEEVVGENCPECDQEMKIRHAVCIVGEGMGVVDDEFVPVYQYLESEIGNEECGVRYITKSSMTVTLPQI